MCFLHHIVCIHLGRGYNYIYIYKLKYCVLLIYIDKTYYLIRNIFFVDIIFMTKGDVNWFPLTR